MGTTHKDRMSEAIREWTIDLSHYPGWKKWKRKQVAHTLFFDDLALAPPDQGMFVFSEEIERQHAVVSQYVGLEKHHFVA